MSKSFPSDPPGPAGATVDPGIVGAMSGGVGPRTAVERIYRLCHLDTQGKVVGEETLMAATDRAALAKMKRARGAHGLELWHGRRWVGCNQPQPAKPPKA